MAARRNGRAPELAHVQPLNGVAKHRSHGGKLSPKSCGLAKLSTQKRSRYFGLSTQKRSRLYAETVAPLIKSLYLPVVNTPVVGAAPFGDKSATCPPTGLHLLPTAVLKIAGTADKPLCGGECGALGDVFESTGVQTPGRAIGEGRRAGPYKKGGICKLQRAGHLIATNPLAT